VNKIKKAEFLNAAVSHFSKNVKRSQQIGIKALAEF